MYLNSYSYRLLAAMVLSFPLLANAQTPRIAFAHFAPLLDDVHIDIDGEQVETLSYSEYRHWTPIVKGVRTLNARRTDGSLVASQQIEVLPEDSITVFLGGAGSPQAPFELIASLDHARPVLGGVTRQEINLALDGDRPAENLRGGRDCVLLPDDRSSYRELTYRHGSAVLFPRQRNLFNLSSESVPQHCGFRIWADDRSAPIHVVSPTVPEPGTRLRVVFAGDGQRRPVRTYVIVQEVAPEASVPPSPALNGLWAVPSRPGWLVVIGIQPSAGDTESEIRGFLLAQNSRGENLWLKIANSTTAQISDASTAFQTIGGSIEGASATFDDQHGTLRIVFHDSVTASLTQLVPAYTGRHGNFDIVAPVPGYFGNDTVRLTRLLPMAEHATGDEQ